MNEFFRRFSHRVSDATGSPWAFIIAVTIILIWSLTGPVFRFSDTWQLVINTSTTIVTFLMVFLIQNTQNRDSKAIHLKLDEIIRSMDKARDSLIDLEDLSDEEIARVQEEFKHLIKRIKNDPTYKEQLLGEVEVVEEEVKTTVADGGVSAAESAEKE
jgi:low affinity Fe/Cu permease